MTTTQETEGSTFRISSLNLLNRALQSLSTSNTITIASWSDQPFFRLDNMKKTTVPHTITYFYDSSEFRLKIIGDNSTIWIDRQTDLDGCPSALWAFQHEDFSRILEKVQYFPLLSRIIKVFSDNHARITAVQHRISQIWVFDAEETELKAKLIAEKTAAKLKDEEIKHANDLADSLGQVLKKHMQQDICLGDLHEVCSHESAEAVMDFIQKLKEEYLRSYPPIDLLSKFNPERRADCDAIDELVIFNQLVANLTRDLIECFLP